MPRTPFQGVWNIIRFNWHFYLLAVSALGVAVFLIKSIDVASSPYLYLLLLLFLIGTLVATTLSLGVSFYVYDWSNLYRFTWLDDLMLNEKNTIVNIHAGFDETSVLLQQHFPTTQLSVFDFYNPAQHTEISIKRARKAYPPYPNTQVISTIVLPLAEESVAAIFVLFAAHEIRNEVERILFFQEINRCLTPNGQLFVTEHLRDLPNFLAYNLGFFHFLSKKTWQTTFQKSNFMIQKEIMLTPFVRNFVLEKI
ncbi:MAG: hypothetical protein RLZZ292_2365 [Bacteroidota bacterium]|jgi:SAM-dependent methyltransferase